MKKFSRITAVIMAMLMCGTVFASCGGGNSDSGSASGSDSGNSSAADTVKANTETWGNITVDVPDGMKLKGGNVIDEKNPDVVNISKIDNEMNYFLITINDDEDSAKSGVDTTREINEGAKDVSLDAGVKWTGVSYDSAGTPAFQIYGEFEGRYAVVQCYGFSTEDEATTTVLSSLKVAAKE